MQHSQAIVLRAWAAGLAPDPIVATKDWIRDNLVVADGPRAGQKFDYSLTPYIPEVLDALDDESCNVVVVRKSAQVAFTTVAIGWVCANMDTAPAHDMLIQPTIAAAIDFNRKKLQPAIESAKALRKKVRRQVARSGEGSTALVKSFPGGSLTLTGANSAADLRSKTTKRQVRDEIDEYPLDLDGQGDPEEMMDARLISFHATGEWKVLKGSTPTIKGASRIDAAYEASDQRKWHVCCPHCTTEQVLEFGDKASRHGLKFNSEFPFEAHYVCRAHGCIIEHAEKAAMVRGGRWVALNPGPGRPPGFHIDALISLLTTWDSMAEAFVRAKDDPQKLKTFTNLWLGQSWENRGDAPDWEVLLLRREAFPAKIIPPGGLLLTGAADVQMDGIYYEVVAWGADKQSWSIDVGYIQGDTADVRGTVWAKLREVIDTRYADSYGRTWPADLFAVDSGYRTNVVYEFCRRHPVARAVKGTDGWYKPAITTSPTKQQVTIAGKKRGVNLWPIGTWPLKAELYANLRKEGLKDGAEAPPPGYCHFSTELHHEVYFRQLTAEHLVQEERAGRLMHRWDDGGRANHWLDCRIMARAMAELLGVSRLNSDDWAKIIAARGPTEAAQRDMFASALAGAPKPRIAGAPARAVQRKMRIN